MLGDIPRIVHRHLALGLVFLDNVILTAGFILGLIFVISHVGLVDGDSDRAVSLLNCLVGVFVRNLAVTFAQNVRPELGRLLKIRLR